MSLKYIDVPVLGQMLRLNVPEEQHDALRHAARHLEQRMIDMKERTGILQIEKVFAIVALNLSYELGQAQHKIDDVEQVLRAQLQVLSHSLETLSEQKFDD